MTNADSSPSYQIPKIGRIQFRGFDLYTEQPDASVSISKNVFCLIGANGLGKTTFLNTLIFALTGAIPNPTRKFLSAQKYLKEASRPDRTADYFEGRVSEANRPNACVTIQLVWPNKRITVTRNFFDGANITALDISGNNGETLSFNAINTDSETDLKTAYSEHIKELTGIEDYAQFVFLVHFILTFDEGRHLLMWDDAALTNALYLAFGSNPDDARKADKLRADMNRMDSRGRNAKYAARQTADRVTVLTEASETETGDNSEEDEHEEKLLQKHADLINGFKAAEVRRDEKRNALQDTEMKWSEASANLTEFRLEYQKAFSTFFQGNSSAHHHPVIKATISENRCAVCATEGVAEVVEQALEAGSCPLCRSNLENSVAKDEDTDRLKTLDLRISQTGKEISAHLEKRDRQKAEHEVAVDTAKIAEGLLAEFENASGDFFKTDKHSLTASPVAQAIATLKIECDQLTSESKELYGKRDEFRKLLRPLEAKLRQEYDAAAITFVPRFRQLAEEFIGKEIDIGLKHHHQSKTKSGFGLTLSMGGELRQQAMTVSESQGFFVDIALRMALAEYMSAGPATLFIDTPEGSLDIAYEARAGAMFANFADTGNCIIMTANLRSSELVRRLARRLGHSGMQIELMTEWTELSEVQKEEEELFEKAYREISDALGGS